MTQPFLITGLPRSRTAWMAALCNSQANTICHHEPVRQFGSWRDSLSLWREANRYGHVGISDSALGFHLAEIIKQFEPNVLVIQRDQQTVESSLAVLGVDARAYCDVLSRRIAASLRNPAVMTVGFSELADPDVVVECLRWLVPGALLDRDKVQIMCRLNVQAEMSLVREELSRGVISAAEVLGADVLEEIERCRSGQ